MSKGTNFGKLSCCLLIRINYDGTKREKKKTCSTGEGFVCLAEAMNDLPPRILPDMLFIHKDVPAKPPRTNRRREEARIQRSKGLEAAVGRRFRGEELDNGRGLDLTLRPRKLQVFDMVNSVWFQRGFGAFQDRTRR